MGKVLNIPTGPGQVEQVRRRLGNMHEGICEGLGVEDEGTQQQLAAASSPAPSELRLKIQGLKNKLR